MKNPVQLRHLPIQRRLVAIICCTTLAVLLGSYLILFFYDTRRSVGAAVETLDTVGDIIASNSSAAMIFDDPRLAGEILSGLRADPDITAAALYDRQGRIFASYPAAAPRSAFPAAPGASGPRFSLRQLLLYEPVMQDASRVGTLYLESNLGVMYRSLRVYGLVLIGVLAGGVLFAFYLSEVFQRQISRPILSLAETSRIVSEQKDYSVRAQTRSGDELGFVTDAFNTMLDQIQRSRDEALNASRAKDDFLAALSHELRTPLNPVLLLATEAMDDPEIPAGARADFDIIRKNVELEARLIDDLLDLTRITSGKLVLRQELVDVHTIITDALSTVEADMAAKGIELTLDFAAEHPVVLGDPVRLQQVFWNVLKNAVKFTPDGGKIAVSTEAPEPRSQLIVRVADTGIGISSDEARRVFEAFSQGDHARGSGYHRFGGLGLGLAISRKMIEMHSGQIRAESQGRDRGSTFVIELPLAPLSVSGTSRSTIEG